MSFGKMNIYIWVLFLIISIILLISAVANLKEDIYKAENEKAYNLFYSFGVFFVLALISFFVFNRN